MGEYNCEKNKYYHNRLNNNPCDNICFKNNSNKNFNSSLNNLFEVENFLCNLATLKKSVNLYKFLKK